MSTGQNICRNVEGEEKEVATPVKVESADGAVKPETGSKLIQQSDVLNVISKDTTVKLRKNKYPFVTKRHWEQKKKESKDPDGEGGAATSKVTLIPTSTTTPALPAKERKLIAFRNKV